MGKTWKQLSDYKTLSDPLEGLTFLLRNSIMHLYLYKGVRDQTIAPIIVYISL